jgi:hypothetical protein
MAKALGFCLALAALFLAAPPVLAQVPRVAAKALGFCLALAALFLAAPPALAQVPRAAAKAKPCPKGTVATTSKITGDQACFSMTVRPSPHAVPAPAKQVKKP